MPRRSDAVIHAKGGGGGGGACSNVYFIYLSCKARNSIYFKYHIYIYILIILILHLEVPVLRPAARGKSASVTS